MSRFAVRLFSTGFLSGELPGAPGTYGTIVGLILLSFFPILSSWYIILTLIILGVWLSEKEASYSGIKDDPRIVIDEIAGYFLVYLGLPINWVYLLAGFILFRFFDIVKPGPIKNSQELPGGWGVMADDLLAGIAASIILRLIIWMI